MKKIIFLILILGVALGLYSKMLLAVPTGLTVDEAAFGYNAALLAKTGRDERGLRMPFFVLSINGKDWRQPVTQYYLAGLFKIFGSSVYLLRFSSIIVALFSIIGIYVLANELIGGYWGLIASIFLATMPIFFIQSHMGLDNIMPVPFTLLWLWSIFSYRKKFNWRWLVLAGISLGINFYTYKGMRAVFPLWFITSVVYLILIQKDWMLRLKSILFFGVGTFPFMAIIPYLEKNFSGAILGGSSPTLNNFYNLVIPYLSSFDLSYLFVRGDSTFFHSTGIHGMLLLSTLPVLIVGLYKIASSKNHELKTILVALVTAPLLYSLVGSEHRFSRLLCLLPLYALIMTIGLKYVWETTQKWRWLVCVLFATLIFVNFGDFLKYYWTTYPGVTQTLLGNLSYYLDFKTLSDESKKSRLEPILHQSVVQNSGESGKFYQIIYFGKLLKVINDDVMASPGQALLTLRKEIPGNMIVDSNHKLFYVQISESK